MRSASPQRAGQHFSGLNQLWCQVDALDPAAKSVSEVARRATGAAADIQNAAVLGKRYALGLLTCCRQTTGMEMVDRR